MIRKFWFLIVFLGLASFAAIASPGEYSRIARLSHIEGHVSFQHPNEVDWSAASINMALQPEDRIYTGDDGRAEIEFDDGSVLRLAEKTDLEILSLREDLIQLRVLVGLCSLTVHSSVGFEINTPAAAFNTQKKGVYRFDVAEDGASDAIVRKGRLEVANNQFSEHIDSGDLIHVTPGDQGTRQVSRYDSRDAWDEWTDGRDADLMAYASRRYIPDNVYAGVGELDRYGHWVTVDSYGPAWVPYYADAGWSPYWEGRWCYRPYWGWTWVSYEPWGWLPYHYGRWHHAGFGWCWLPGPSFGFNFWSPGLVRFYHGPSWVSWVPLGPGDYYNVNHYHYNTTYNYQINNIRLIQNRAPNDLVNRNVAGAFRTVRTQDFVGSSFGGRGRTAVSENVDQPWKHGQMVTDRLPVQPSSTSFAPAPDRAAVRPTMNHSLPSIVRTMPTVANAGRDRFVPIGGSVSTVTPGSRSEGRNAPAAGESAGRGAATGGNSSIWSRVPNRTQSENIPGGRVTQTPSVPGNNGSRMENPSRGREAAPATPSVIERSRTGNRENLNPRSARPEPQPTRRMESTPAPRYERPTPAPRPEVERSRPQERPRPQKPESYSYVPRSTWQESYSARSVGVARAAEVARGYESPAPRSAPPSSWAGSRTSYSAPAAPSRSWGGGGSSFSAGTSSQSLRSAPSHSAPSGNAGAARPRGR